MQDKYAIEAYYKPCENYLSAKGIKLSTRPYVIRGAVFSYAIQEGTVTAALGGAYVYVRRQRHQIASQTSRINSLQTVISEQEGQLAQANALNNTLRDKIDSDQKTLDAYEIPTGLTPDEVNAPVGP